MIVTNIRLSCTGFDQEVLSQPFELLKDPDRGIPSICFNNETNPLKRRNPFKHNQIKLQDLNKTHTLCRNICTECSSIRVMTPSSS